MFTGTPSFDPITVQKICRRPLLLATLSLEQLHGFTLASNLWPANDTLPRFMLRSMFVVRWCGGAVADLRDEDRPENWKKIQLVTDRMHARRLVTRTLELAPKE